MPKTKGQNGKQGTGEPAPLGVAWRWAAAALVVAALGAVPVILRWGDRGSPRPSEEPVSAARTNLFGKPKGTVLGAAGGGSEAPQEANSEAGEAGPVAPVPAVKVVTRTPEEASALARQLVGALTGGEFAGRALTAETAAAWKTNLAQLVAQGSASVPAIREFLEKNLDFDLGAAGKGWTGYASARAALFDALLQIGGPEATEALRQALQGTADPREIAHIAKNLETLGPDQGRQEGLTAARAALAMALQGQLADRDVGPIFELYQKYGGADVVAELEKAASRWNYYAAIALVNLPDGAGIPSLINVLAGDGSSGGVSKLNAYQMLASVASQYPEARSVLLSQVQQGKVMANYWPYLASVLGGDQFFFQDTVFGNTAPPAGTSDTKSTHIAYGNQNFYKAPSTLSTAEQLNQQLNFVNELMGATTDAAAQQALQQAKDQLLKRLGQ